MARFMIRPLHYQGSDTPLSTVCEVECASLFQELIGKTITDTQKIYILICNMLMKQAMNTRMLKPSAVLELFFFWCASRQQHFRMEKKG
jgi:hypothetical protein